MPISASTELSSQGLTAVREQLASSDIAKRPPEEAAKPDARLRILALCLYLGLAPVAWIRCRVPGSPYWKTHLRQSLTLWAFLGVTGILLLLTVLALSISMVYQRESVDARDIELVILSVGRKSILVWCVFWFYCVWRCLRGSAEFVPFLRYFSQRSFFYRAGMFFVTLFFVAGLLTGSSTLRAESLVTQDASRARTFMLYDDLGLFPRPLFSLAMYRLARESVRRWGPGSAVMLPLTREAINLASHKGVFVFIGSHGTSQGLLLDGTLYRPEDVPRHAGSGLRYVYLASCDSGAQRDAWEEAFAPATVKTYDRLVPTLEHLWWLWTEGPALLRNLPEPVH